jgi:CRISPR-associated exonuclease Cas4
MPPFPESDLLPISALQHLIYCPRQCALIHNEQQWAENRLTVEGQQLHDKAHDARKAESRPGVRIARGLRLRSFELGITGQADVVEFHHDEADAERGSASEASGPAPASVLPIEYKRGRPKRHHADEVQLCAQALCLEEMLGLPGPIPAGRLFYGQTRRRQDVPFDPTLRQRTRHTIAQLRELIDSGQTPPARYEPRKCDRCSLIELCMPRQVAPRRTARRVFLQSLEASLGGT